MSDDNLRLQVLLERHDITVKQLAMWTGRAASTLYKYLSGELTIPSIVWRTVFERTLDVEVLMLFSGSVPCIIAPLVEGKNKSEIGETTLRQLIETRQAQINCEGYILKILEDGRVDKNDAPAVANYKRGFGEMLKSQAHIFRAITSRFDAAIKKQGQSHGVRTDE